MADKNQRPKPPHAQRDPSRMDPSLNPEFSNVPAEAEPVSVSERVMHATWEIIKTVAFIVLAAVIIRAVFLQPFFVEGESMEPSFHSGNYLLINQISYRFSKPGRGDVIVFKAISAGSPDTNYIKRVIGLPGETVELRDGQVIVYNDRHRSGATLTEPYEPVGTRTLPDSGQTRWEIGEDQYFVLGDNRHAGESSDSRSWGLLQRDAIIGKAWIRVYPLAQVGPVRHEEFPALSSGTFGTLGFGHF